MGVRGRTALVATTAVAALLWLVPSASAEHNLTQLTPGGDVATMMSADGSHVAFSSNVRLVPSDTDGLYDIYDWQDNGTLQQASVPEPGQTATQQYRLQGTSSDGEHIIFDTTLDRLAPDDIDGGSDVYDRFARATTRLVSRGAVPSTAAFAATYEGMTPDGSRQFSARLSK